MYCLKTMDESDIDVGERTPTKQPVVFVPETPSPLFSRLAHNKDTIMSPSRRKYWFEDVQGKVGAEVNKNGCLKVAEYDKKKTAFDRLKKIRQKKNASKNFLNFRKKSTKSYNGTRPQDEWPSDSDSDSESESDSSTGQTLSGLLNREEKKQRSPVKGPATSLFNPITSASSSTPPDSPSLAPPLRKRIRLGLSNKLFGTCGLNTPTDKESNASETSSSSSNSSKHRQSKPRQSKYKLSASDFVSARHVMNGVQNCRTESASSLDSSSIDDHRSETPPHSDNFHSKQDRKHRKKDNKPKSVLDGLKSVNRGRRVQSVDMELTPPFTIGMSSANLSTLPAQNFYKKCPVKKLSAVSRESNTASSSESDRPSQRPSKRMAKRPAPTTHAPEIVDVASDDDSVIVVNQVVSDETMARRLQEEMDREFALAIAESHTPFGPEAPVGSHRRGSRSRDPHPASPGFMMSMFHDIGPDTDEQIQDFPFMVSGGWGQSPLALLTSHVALLGSSGNWASPMRNRRPVRSGGRGTRGRTGRRNAIINSPGVNGEDYEALLDLAESIGDVRPKGLSKSEINCLPVKKFVPSSGESSQNKECLVCMCEFEKDDNVRILTCFHDFHSKCIDKWLKANSTCPICRVDVKLS